MTSKCWKGSTNDRIGDSPVLPGLETRLVEEIVERLPVIENLVAVVDDVRGGAHVPQDPERHER